MAVKKKDKTDEGMVTVILDNAQKGEDTHQFVSFNGKTYRVKKGVPVAVPVGVAEIIMNAKTARKERDEYEYENTQTK